MKSLWLFFFCMLAATLPCRAQTNTFPSSGNVGIGTTSPGEALQVVGKISSINNTNSTVGSNLAQLGSGTTPELIFMRSNAVWADTWWDWRMGTDNKLRLGYSTVTQITLQNGAMGLGTDSPLNGLHVARGDVRVSRNNDVYGPNLLLDATVVGTGGTLWGIGSTTAADSAGGGKLVFVQGGSNRMVLDSVGKLGLGTTNPTARLTLFGSGGSVSDNGIEWFSGGNASGYWGWAGRVYTDVPTGGWGTAPLIFSVPDATGNPVKVLTLLNGNVGVKTSAPKAALDVWNSYGAGTDSVRFSFHDGTAAYWMGIQPYVVGAGNVGYKFRTANGATTAEAFAITGDGKVGIGTTSPTHKLAVNGTIRAKEVIVDTGWADHVFAADYRLAPLSEVEQHIQQNGHLPDVPSAADIAARGVSVGEMQKVLLQKVEELTLHVIAQQKLVAEQARRLDAQADRISGLEHENALLRARDASELPSISHP